MLHFLQNFSYYMLAEVRPQSSVLYICLTEHSSCSKIYLYMRLAVLCEWFSLDLLPTQTPVTSLRSHAAACISSIYPILLFKKVLEPHWDVLMNSLLDVATVDDVHTVNHAKLPIGVLAEAFHSHNPSLCS